jgi:hypothetical protein
VLSVLLRYTDSDYPFGIFKKGQAIQWHNEKKGTTNKIMIDKPLCRNVKVEQQKPYKKEFEDTKGVIRIHVFIINYFVFSNFSNLC